MNLKNPAAELADTKQELAQVMRSMVSASGGRLSLPFQGLTPLPFGEIQPLTEKATPWPMHSGANGAMVAQDMKQGLVGPDNLAKQPWVRTARSHMARASYITSTLTRCYPKLDFMPE